MPLRLEFPSSIYTFESVTVQNSRTPLCHRCNNELSGCSVEDFNHTLYVVLWGISPVTKRTEAAQAELCLAYPCLIRAAASVIYE